VPQALAVELLVRRPPASARGQIGLRHEARMSFAGRSGALVVRRRVRRVRSLRLRWTPRRLSKPAVCGVLFRVHSPQSRDKLPAKDRISCCFALLLISGDGGCDRCETSCAARFSRVLATRLLPNPTRIRHVAVNVRARDVDGPVQTRCVLTSTASSDNLADRVAYILPKMPPNTSSELPAKPLRSLTEVYGHGRGRVAARPRSVHDAD
jgi:hypothetical protein